MVLDKLGDSLKNSLKKLTGSYAVDEKIINELAKDIQRALLQADVNVRLVLELTKKIKERALKEKLTSGINKKEQIVNIVFETLVEFLGGKGNRIDITKKPFKVMLVGLFGNGKTTTAGKLANYYKKRGNSIALISTDTWRPAAFTQLQQLGKQIGVPVYGDPSLKDPTEIYNKFKAELEKHDLIFIDTAGRDALNDELIDELNSINKTVAPDETLLVMAADVGQAAKIQAEKFNDTCNVTGVIITKLDGTAKGGGALTACSITNAPVKFIGVGEKTDDFEEFKAEGFVGRLLGLGDLEALLEKAKLAINMSEEDAEDMKNKMLKGKFNLLDLYSQMESMGKMGSLKKIMTMIPGMSNIGINDSMLDVSQDKIKYWKYLMNSMTKLELEDPEVITGSRVKRIAAGAGLDETEMRALLKQYKQSKKMMKMMKGNMSEKGMQKMMQKMQSGKMGGKKKILR
jgi:signal recognition particle subunit SRP54